MPAPLRVHFVGGHSGRWRVNRVDPVVGSGLPVAERLTVHEAPTTEAYSDAAWVLRGSTSNTRYTNKSEVGTLVSKQRGLQRPEATRAALIPIRKTAAWWDLAQDERRAVFEEQSRHIGIGLDYLPAIARRLHHSRHGLNTLPNIALRSKIWLKSCDIPPNGSSLSVKSTSG
jgi:hypothetical protein